MRDVYDLVIGRAEVAQRPVRIRLWIDDNAPELHALHWERMYHLRKGHPVPLLTSTLTPFSRYVKSHLPSPQPVAERPIRILFAVSNPAGLDNFALMPLELEHEVAALHEALGDLQQRGLVQIRLLALDVVGHRHHVEQLIAKEPPRHRQARDHECKRREVDPGKRELDRHRPGRKDEGVVLERLCVAPRAVRDPLPHGVQPDRLRPETDVDPPLAAEEVRPVTDQSVARLDDPADVVGRRARAVRDVLALFEDDDLDVFFPDGRIDYAGPTATDIRAFYEREFPGRTLFRKDDPGQQVRGRYMTPGTA